MMVVLGSTVSGDSEKPPQLEKERCYTQTEIMAAWKFRNGKKRSLQQFFLLRKNKREENGIAAALLLLEGLLN